MKTHTEYHWFNTKQRIEIVNIHDKVEQAVKTSGIKEGFVLVSAMHITAGVFVNDDEEGFRKDLMEMLERLSSRNKDYHHNMTGEDNGYAHMWNILVHHQVIIPVTDGHLDIGPWQRVFYAEFDGQRKKRLIIKVMGE